MFPFERMLRPITRYLKKEETEKEESETIDNLTIVYRVDLDITFDDVLGNPLRKGEFIISCLDEIEDSKGRTKETGILTLTNLRIIWYKKENIYQNISIGLKTIKKIKKKLNHYNITKRGNNKYQQNKTIFIYCKYDKSNFQFEFTNHKGFGGEPLFHFIEYFTKIYHETCIFRDLIIKGRDLIIIDKDGNNNHCNINNCKIKLLDGEEILEEHAGFFSITNLKGILGTITVTNLRICWHGSTLTALNISIPFLVVSKINIGKSKNYGGIIFVIEVNMNTKQSYSFGFYCNDENKVILVYKIIQSMYKHSKTKPNYGIPTLDELLTSSTENNYSSQKSFHNIKEILLNNNNNLELRKSKIMETVQFVGKEEYINDLLLPKNLNIKNNNFRGDWYKTNYEERIDGNNNITPIYNEEIDLAIEPIKNSTSLETLWKCIYKV
ncbi:hypothetical protein ABK040_007303 [Willaertia magna]